MPNLLVKPHIPDDKGCTLRVTPETAQWKYVGFASYQLQPGQIFEQQETHQEACVVILTGKAHAYLDDRDLGIIGDRMNLFESKKPYALYSPPNGRIRLIAETKLELGVATAPLASTHPPARLIMPGDIDSEERGQGTNKRFVHNILPDTAPAGRLLVVEVYTPAGNWSSYPPHKHDHDEPPHETQLEETYYHRLNPKQGFAFQRVYTDDRSLDETLSVEDGDVVMVPRGYHPVGAPHGYDLYYLNVMAGPIRKWIFKNDPAHEWIVKR